jgi:hypothetical protein
MPHYAALRDYNVDLEADDIRGAVLEDRSGNKIGTITDAIIEHESGAIRYLVAAVSGREVLVPAGRIFSSSNDETVQADLTLSEAERLPTAEESGVLQGKGVPEYASSGRAQEASSYKADDTEGTVIHREGSDHLVTPEPGEMPMVPDNEDIDSSRLTPNRMADKFGGVGQPITAITGIPRGAGGSSDVSIGGGFEIRPEQNDFPELDSKGRRWDRFAQSLKTRHLETMRQSCDVCASKRAA